MPGAVPIVGDLYFRGEVVRGKAASSSCNEGEAASTLFSLAFKPHRNRYLVGHDVEHGRALLSYLDEFL